MLSNDPTHWHLELVSYDEGLNSNNLVYFLYETLYSNNSASSWSIYFLFFLVFLFSFLIWSVLAWMRPSDFFYCIYHCFLFVCIDKWYFYLSERFTFTTSNISSTSLISVPKASISYTIQFIRNSINYY